MRFSAAIQPHPPLRTPAVAETVRRLVSREPAEHPQPAPTPRADDLPLDLDQRVRLIGEW
jgi:hypothetical protein